jgi:glycosyltransferase involved in cell wall biosynthesis
LKECDVFVLPSFYREGVPRSLQEALAMGIALITTNNVGCCDTVTEGSNGFLVPIQDAEAVADRMMRFVEDSNLVETMGKASRRLAEQNFDVIQKVESQMVIIEGGSGNS